MPLLINSKLLLLITFICVFIVYWFLFPLEKIIELIKEQYILIIITSILAGIYLYLKHKLKDKLIYEFIPNTRYVSLKSSIVFFIVFEIVDYYSEDGFVGMISQWIVYWIFGVLGYFLINNINLYKNYKAYKNFNI